MSITYSDKLGLVTIEIDTEYGIDFNDGLAYFTYTNGVDYKIPVTNIITIQK